MEYDLIQDANLILDQTILYIITYTPNLSRIDGTVIVEFISNASLLFHMVSRREISVRKEYTAHGSLHHWHSPEKHRISTDKTTFVESIQNIGKNQNRQQHLYMQTINVCICWSLVVTIKHFRTSFFFGSVWTALFFNSVLCNVFEIPLTGNQTGQFWVL